MATGVLKVKVGGAWQPLGLGAVEGATASHHTTHEPGGSDALTALSADVLTSGTLSYARVAVSAASRLLGRGSSGAGTMEELTLGTGLSMTGTVLSATAAGGGGDVYKDQPNIFTKIQTIQYDFAALALMHPSAISDSKRWHLTTDGSTLAFQTVTDLGTPVQETPLVLRRTGNRVTVNGHLVVSGPPSGDVTSRIKLIDTGQPADLKQFQIYNYSQTFQVVAINDAENAIAGAHLVLDRNGMLTNNGQRFELVGSIPYLAVRDTSQPSGSQAFIWQNKSQNMYLTAWNDTYTANPVDCLVVSRAGNMTVTGRTTMNALTVSGGNENYFSAYSHIRLHLRETSQAAGNQTWTIMNHQAALHFSATPDAEGMNWTSGPTITFGRAGAITTPRGGSITCGWDLYSTAPIYPGREDTGWNTQSSWYLSSHGSYGLRSSAGLYVTGDVWAAGGLYERGRGTRIGEWIGQPFSQGNFGAAAGTWTINSQVQNTYTLIGKTLIWNLWVQGTLSAGTVNLFLILPGGYTTTVTNSIWNVGYLVNGSTEYVGLTYPDQTNRLLLRRTAPSANFVAGALNVGLSIAIPIA